MNPTVKKSDPKNLRFKRNRNSVTLSGKPDSNEENHYEKIEGS